MTDLFSDRYDIQRELGRGVFGVVYLAHDLRLRNRPVALKILHPVLSTDPGVMRLFQNEAGVLATLQHDHIVTVHDVDVWQRRTSASLGSDDSGYLGAITLAEWGRSHATGAAAGSAPTRPALESTPPYCFDRRWTRYELPCIAKIHRVVRIHPPNLS